MKCKSTCMFCDGNRTYLFNYSGFHGVCFQHCNFESEFYQCSYCNSVVPVIPRSCGSCSAQVSLILNKENQIELSADDSYVNNLRLLPCGEYHCVNCINSHIKICIICNPSFECQVCRQAKSNQQAINCEHLICTDCFEYYKICTLCEANKPKLNCQICFSDEGVQIMKPCNSHQVCLSCYQKSGNYCTVCLGTFSCPDCNNPKYFRSQLECGHTICHECFPNHNCFKCQVCESTSEVYLMTSCNTHHICQVCYSKSNNQCTLCIGKYHCDSCSTPKYFTFKLPCQHDICYDCSQNHDCAPKQSCNLCGSNQEVKLSDSCKTHHLCHNCFIKAQNTCVLCSGTFKCIQCKNYKYHKSQCNHNLCSECSQTYQCKDCQKASNKASLPSQTYQNPNTLEINIQEHESKPRTSSPDLKELNLSQPGKSNQPERKAQPSIMIQLPSHKESIKTDDRDLSKTFEIEEEVHSPRHQEHHPFISQNSRNSRPANYKSEKAESPSCSIGVNLDKAPLNPKPEKQSKLKCSCRFVLLVFLYIISLFYLCGCFFNCCRGFAARLPSPKSLFCLGACAEKSQAKKEWKYLVTFGWFSSNKHN